MTPYTTITTTLAILAVFQQNLGFDHLALAPLDLWFPLYYTTTCLLSTTRETTHNANSPIVKLFRELIRHTYSLKVGKESGDAHGGRRHSSLWNSRKRKGDSIKALFQGWFTINVTDIEEIPQHIPQLKLRDHKLRFSLYSSHLLFSIIIDSSNYCMWIGMFTFSCPELF